jgi:hypothetical protein
MKRTISRILRPAALGLATLACSASAGAIQLTGLWHGTITCLEYDGVVTKEKDRAGALDITHGDGATFQAAVNGIRAFNGSLIPSAIDGTTQAELVMNSCSVDPFPIDGAPGQMIHLRAKVNPAKGTGTLVGTSIFEDGAGRLGVCKLKFKRHNTIPNPSLPLCPP